MYNVWESVRLIGGCGFGQGGLEFHNQASSKVRVVNAIWLAATRSQQGKLVNTVR